MHLELVFDTHSVVQPHTHPRFPSYKHQFTYSLESTVPNLCRQFLSPSGRTETLTSAQLREALRILGGGDPPTDVEHWGLFRAVSNYAGEVQTGENTTSLIKFTASGSAGNVSDWPNVTTTTRYFLSNLATYDCLCTTIFRQLSARHVAT